MEAIGDCGWDGDWIQFWGHLPFLLLNATLREQVEEAARHFEIAAFKGISDWERRRAVGTVSGYRCGGIGLRLRTAS